MDIVLVWWKVKSEKVGDFLQWWDSHPPDEIADLGAEFLTQPIPTDERKSGVIRAE